MATNLSFLSQCLDQQGWKYEVDTESQRVITGVKAKHVERFIIVLQLSEDGKYIQFNAPMLLQVTEAVHYEALMRTMAQIQYQVKMLRLEQDSRDGEIRASIDLPLEDASLTPKQFYRCLSGLIEMVDNIVMPRLKAVLATGEDPGMPSSEERLLNTIPEDVLAMIERAITVRQLRGSLGEL